MASCEQAAVAKEVVAKVDDPECTFKPKITKMARERHSRSPSQLGPQEAARRKARREKICLAKEKLELQQMQEPKIRNYNGVEGRLRLRQDADTLMARIEHSRSVERTRWEKDLNRQRQVEDAACTFKPQIKSSPAFVQRMAATRRAAKEALQEKENGPNQQQKPQDQQVQRLDWQ